MARTSAGGVTELAIQNATHTYAADAEASDTYVITLDPAVTAYVTGQEFAFLANTANTGAATLNVNGLGAKTIVKHKSVTLANNDIKAGSVVYVSYDGTNFQMTSQLGNAPAGSGDLLADGTIPMTADFNLNGNNLDNVGVAFLIEQAAADADVAGSGQFWVKTATPNVAMFTDDAGTDFQIATLTGTETLTNKTLVAPALGTPASGVMTNVTGTAAGLTAGKVTTNANLTGHVTSVGNAAVLGSFTVAQLSTALSDASISGNNTGDEAAADLTTAGVIEIATGAETNTGTDATRAVSPDGLDDWTGSAQVTTLGTISSGDVDAAVSAASVTVAGKVEIATAAETDTWTDATRALSPDGFQASKRNIRWLAFNLIDSATACTVASFGGDFVSPIAGVIQQSDTTPFYLYATNSTAGTTGTMVVDIHLNGTTIMTTNKLDFDTTEKTTTTAATPPDLTTTALAVGDIITFDVDSLHTTPASGLTVYMAVLET